MSTVVDSVSVPLDTLQSGNGSNSKNIKRMELVYGGTSVKFAINPEDYTQKEPNRATLTQTKGGAWIDSWGAGILEFTIKGITGVSGRKLGGTSESAGDSGVDLGYQRWKQLRDLFRSVFNAVQDGEEITELIRFYNYTDNEYWYCYPTQNGIELYRSKSRPHIYQYTINLWGLRRIGEPQTSTGVIGNPNKEGATTEATESTDTSEQMDDTADTSPEAENDENSTTTTKTTTNTVSGGGTYVTGSVALDTQVDVTTVTNTRTKTNYVLREQCHALAVEIAPLIGGDEGLIAPVTGYYTAYDLGVADSGIVMNVQSFRGKDLIKKEDKLDFLMSEVQFSNLVSLETYNMWKSIREYSPEVLSPNYTYPVGATPKERVIQAIAKNRIYDSTIYSYLVQYKPKYYLSKKDINLIKTVMLESMMVYRELERIYNSNGKIVTSITGDGMNTLIKNIHTVILYLEYTGTDFNKFYTQNVAAELRQLESLMLQVYADIVVYL